MGYPTRTEPRASLQARAQAERAEVLTGSRNGATPELRAVTHAEVGALGAIRLKSAHVSAAPTAAEHNALVDDVHALAVMLNAIGAKFTGL